MSVTHVGDTTYWGPEYSITEESELRISYGMYDGLYEGDDWKYIYKFDVENTAAFLAQLQMTDNSKTIGEYIEEHFDSRSSLEEFCEEHGIHGTETHYGEYPPAIFGPYEF